MYNFVIDQIIITSFLTLTYSYQNYSRIIRKQFKNLSWEKCLYSKHIIWLLFYKDYNLFFQGILLFVANIVLQLWNTLCELNQQPENVLLNLVYFIVKTYVSYVPVKCLHSVFIKIIKLCYMSLYILFFQFWEIYTTLS